MPKAPVDSTLRQPATTPNPICVQTIQQGHPEAVQNEVFPRPPLSHCAGGNRRSGVHENHHKEKRTITATSPTPGFRKNPFKPIRPYVNTPVGLPVASTAARVPSLHLVMTNPDQGTDTTPEAQAHFTNCPSRSRSHKSRTRSRQAGRSKNSWLKYGRSSSRGRGQSRPS